MLLGVSTLTAGEQTNSSVTQGSMHACRCVYLGIYLHMYICTCSCRRSIKDLKECCATIDSRRVCSLRSCQPRHTPRPVISKLRAAPSLNVLDHNLIHHLIILYEAVQLW